MRLKSFLLLNVIIFIFITGCANSFNEIITPERNLVIKESSIKKYESLLYMFPEDKQGYGIDPSIEGLNYQAMTYGLVLSAESTRYQSIKTEVGKERIREAVSWIINNNAGDDNVPGWGISVAWDAFQDGTKNPVNQPYTITAAIIIEGLLDALQTTDIFNDKDMDEILNTIQIVFDYYLINAWTYLEPDSGYFWYSTNKNDDYFTPNVSSAFLGVLARYYREQNENIANKEFYLYRINAAAKGIINSVQIKDSTPFWHYVVVPNRLNSIRPNDLVHHAYIIWGMEYYREYVNELKIPWGRKESIHSLDMFWKDDIIHHYPQNVVYEGDNEPFNTRPANLWGTGIMLGLYSKWNEPNKATATLLYIAENHGIWPNLTIYPVEYNNDKNFYSRHGAHVLWGLSNYIKLDK